MGGGQRMKGQGLFCVLRIVRGPLVRNPGRRCRNRMRSKNRAEGRFRRMDGKRYHRHSGTRRRWSAFHGRFYQGHLGLFRRKKEDDPRKGNRFGYGGIAAKTPGASVLNRRPPTFPNFTRARHSRPKAINAKPAKARRIYIEELRVSTIGNTHRGRHEPVESSASNSWRGGRRGPLFGSGLSCRARCAFAGKGPTSTISDYSALVDIGADRFGNSIRPAL